MEIFAFMASIDSFIAPTLRLLNCALRDAVKLPIMRQLPAENGKSRQIILCCFKNYKLQQIITDGVLTCIAFTNGATTRIIDTQKYPSPLGFACTIGGKSISSNKIIIPKGNKMRKSIHNGNIITYYYTSHLINGATVTSRTLVHIKHITAGDQTYKIWLNTHYMVFEFNNRWQLKRDAYEEARIPVV